MTRIIDGKALADSLSDDLANEIEGMPHPPRLTVILVGDDPASHIYVRKKEQAAQRVGIQSDTIRLPSDTAQDDLLTLIRHLNHAPVDAILVQLPLPSHIDPRMVFETIDPDKDVDGFHPVNAGRLLAGDSRYAPCTPKGIMRLLDAAGAVYTGASALVVGCSAIVGRPTALMLGNAGATVTMANIQTRDLTTLCQRSEIVVAAAGCPNLIRGESLQRDAIVIDVGINRLACGRVVGDVAWDECLGIAGAITPVPGGVGPMTIATLMQNTVRCAIQIKD